MRNCTIKCRKYKFEMANERILFDNLIKQRNGNQNSANEGQTQLRNRDEGIFLLLKKPKTFTGGQSLHEFHILCAIL